MQRGLGALPAARPMLFVGNHQTFALDLGLMVEQIVREAGILPRGLAHPAIFAVRGRLSCVTTTGTGKVVERFNPLGSGILC